MSAGLMRHIPARWRYPLTALSGLIVANAGAGTAEAREGLDLSATYTADVSATLAGNTDGRVRYLDNLEVALDADLATLLGVDATTLHLSVLNNLGARPNDDAGSLQGVNNIEVGRAALRLFEAWAEHSFGDHSLRVGLYDLNSEFYSTESAGLLIAPPFGIGSEMAASGPAGPSIFPSSALAARLRMGFGPAKGYMQVAMINARAQTFGDPGGVDLTFGDGVIVVGELGLGDRVRGSIGGWTYTHARDALDSLGPDGLPLREHPAGVYAMGEAHLTKDASRDIAVFVRGGIARGRTQPFTNSLQAGLLVTPALIGRDESAFSIGFHHTDTSSEFRAAQLAAGDTPWLRERAFEITYSDKVAPHLTLQPDLQLLRRTGDGATSRTAVHTTLRVQLAF